MIKYKTIKDLGFTETGNTGDTAYFNTYGYEYKIFELKTKTKGISIFWNQEDLNCTVMRCDKQGNILGQLIIHDEPYLIAIIELHGQKNKSI